VVADTLKVCRGRMSDRTGKRVLIVDDLPEQRDIYATLLRLHGFDVLEAEDGKAAVEIAVGAPPDAIVMDVMLPVLDGWTATRQIRADPRTAQVPVIVLTARGMEADRKESADAGASAFILKPCNPNDILREVRRLTDGS
jgi:two-component system, cell cycle response regulator DivK